MKKQVNSKCAALSKQAEAAAKEAGMSVADFNELALRWMVDMTKANPVFVRSECREFLEEQRNEKGAEVELHPFMERLFSGDLRAVHGATFGDLSSDHVEPEHLFIRGCLESAFNLNSWEDTICQLMTMEPAIRHCPTLQNEAAAIRALIKAENVLGDFCRAVEEI